MRNVLPLFPEAITRIDGETKNDCERNAAKRLLPAIRKAFPQLKLIVLEDALSSNAPHIRLLQELSMNYIIVAKPSDHTYIMIIKRETQALRLYQIPSICRDAMLASHSWISLSQ
ncbi:hypothetical protein [Candidatus Parabeggiatoa sp. HSG14]|uniref:hypothetical protein n=1 Tax=Candidatus Parabeggiatoa sp. HSG14 TaxID=3055593 RepID=UPI0025A705AD|nr:hypothetical protein [Thiotrichales bacterium HSG14]